MVAAIVVTSSCSTDGDSPSPERADEFSREVATAIDEAQNAGASQEQIDVLVRAQESGEVSFEDAQQAAMRTVECVEDAGGTGEYFVEHVALDFSIPSFTIGGDTRDFEDIDAVLDGCDQLESFWALMLYQTQPAYAEAQAVFLDTRREARVACVRALGIDIPEDTDWDDVTALIHDSTDAGVKTCAAN